jgi:peptidoglycan/LPS O-acetylase OafA/YrhL
MHVQFSYPPYAYPIAFLGLQSFFPDLAIPPGNPPLWSLSVELVMSITLLVLVHFRRKQAKLVLVFSLISLGLIWPDFLILYCMPFFYVGYILPDIKKMLTFQRFYSHVFLFISLVVSILSRHFLNISNGRQEYLFLLLQTSILGFFCLALPKTKGNFLTFASKRSYSLYAIHFPVILMIEKVYFSDTVTLGLVQIGVSISCVAIITEITYRMIDLPSIAASQQYLERRFQI